MSNRHPAKLEHLPNFFILGAAKAGTTTLYRTLQQYPEVYFPYRKEPAFFCDDEYYNQGLGWYQETFFRDAAGTPWRGDATPKYLFWGQKVAPRLEALYSGHPPRFVVIFREPVSLVRSFYWHSIRYGRESLPLREALQTEPERTARHFAEREYHGNLTHFYSQIGNYASQLEPYLGRFSRENFLFLLTEDLQDFPGLLQKLENFFSLKPNPQVRSVHENRARLPRNQQLNQVILKRSKLKDFLKKFIPLELLFRIKKTVRNWNMQNLTPPPLEADLAQRLREHYRPEMQKLETIIQRDLSAWHTEP